MRRRYRNCPNINSRFVIPELGLFTSQLLITPVVPINIMHVYTMHVLISHVYTYTYIYIYVYTMHILIAHVYVYVYVYTCICICVRRCICICTVNLNCLFREVIRVMLAFIQSCLLNVKGRIILKTSFLNK